MSIVLNGEILNRLFPARLHLDERFRIKSTGPSLDRLMPASVGSDLADLFETSPTLTAQTVDTLVASATPIELRARTGTIVLRGVAARDGAGLVLLVGHAPPVEGSEASPPLGADDFSVAEAGYESLKARVNLVVLNRSKSDFLARISRELRTPLHGVIGIVGSLADSPLNSAQAEMVALIQESGVALNRVVDDVLDFARLESGFLTSLEEPLNLADELGVAAHAFDGEAVARGVKFSVDIAQDLSVKVVADAGRIRQIVSTLVANGVKAGQVSTVRMAARLGHGTGTPHLRLEVSDNGPGMGAEALSRVFQGFAVGEPAQPSGSGPAGLGLAICKGLVDRMGGEIVVRSEVGKGATFEVTLPLRLATEAESEVLESVTAIIQAAPTDDDDAPVRALVAEDHPANRRIIELMLAPMGVEVTLVGNGAEAVEAFRQHDWELVLLDMQMPVLDGVSAARAMRELEVGLQRQRTPIAMLSANVLPRHVQEALGAGADHFIAKPVTPAALARGLDELIRAAAMNAAKASTH